MKRFWLSFFAITTGSAIGTLASVVVDLIYGTLAGDVDVIRHAWNIEVVYFFLQKLLPVCVLASILVALILDEEEEKEE